MPIRSSASPRYSFKYAIMHGSWLLTSTSLCSLRKSVNRATRGPAANQDIATHNVHCNRGVSAFILWISCLKPFYTTLADLLTMTTCTSLLWWAAEDIYSLTRHHPFLCICALKFRALSSADKWAPWLQKLLCCLKRPLWLGTAASGPFLLQFLP